MVVKRLKGTTIAKILPSLVTLAALSCGASAVRAASLGRFDISIYLLFFAAVFDGLDGHVARLLHAATEFGAELDSLCDLVDFGVSPALIVNFWAEKTLSSDLIPDWALWMGSLIFCCSCAYRLARFNLTDITTPKPKEIAKEMADYTSSEEEEETSRNQRPKSKFIRKMNDAMDGYITKKKFFQGIPAPVGGALALLPLVWNLYGNDFKLLDGRLLVVLNLILVSLLMTSKVPTLSSKMFMRDPRRESHLKSRSLKTLFLKVAFSISFFYVLIAHPWELSFVSAFLYYCSIPFGVFVFYTIPDEKTKKAA